MEREKERELELEAAMYTNCLLLGLDPIIIGLNTTSTTTTTTPRVGLFRHSNPKLGEQLLYFLLSSLRGPIQSAKDFDKVWPIFDSAQSRDFRKVVQSIINELESQGALPRSNSRVSSLATCCGPRFIELLWQLSLHALREVHRRTFVSDVASSPLPAPLTDVAFSHAATLLPVTKARIALERRRFLKNAEMAVNRQAMWSNLAHEMTAEFRGLCAEEAYLQQELEKLQDLRNKAKLDGELWDDRVSSSSSQNSHLISKATRLWESLLARKGQHEVLASGPIEDLINHREHRYRISGSSLLAAMDQTSQVPYGDVLSVQPGDMDSALANDKEVMDSSSANVNRQKNYLDLARVQNDDTLSRAEERSGRAHPTVDIAEILRRWTHALQRIHKQSLHMAKANGGEGPELLQSAHDGGANGHAVTLASTLTEHKQHLASIQVLVDQLKEAAPVLQKSISELTEEANSISSTLPPLTKFHGRSTSPFQAQSSGRTMESSLDDVSEVTSKLSSVKLQKASSSPPTLKLPQLFSLTPNSSAKNAAKRHTFSQTSQIDNGLEGKQPEQPQPSSSHVDNPSQDGSSSHVQNLKRSVREAALSVQSCNIESSHDNQSDDGSEHFFVPLSVTGFSRTGGETKSTPMRSKQQFSSPSKTRSLRIPNSHRHAVGKFDDKQNVSTDSTPFHETDSHVNGYASCIGPKYPVFDSHKSLYDAEESQDQVFSPPLLMDTSLLNDPFEDLLAPLSEIDAALMEH